jgi:hypothetical protein
VGSGPKDEAGPPLGVNVMTAPVMTWKKLARRLGTDGNPLRRRTDRIEAWLLPAAAAAFLALSPLVAGGTGSLVRTDIAAARQAEHSWHHVPAVVLKPVAGPASAADTWTVWAPARWTAAGGRHVANVPVPARTSAGSLVTVWLDRAGKVELPPLTAGQARGHVIAMTLIALAILAGFLAGMVSLTRWVLNRRRLTAWEIAWRSVAPIWTGKR